MKRWLKARIMLQVVNIPWKLKASLFDESAYLCNIYTYYASTSVPWNRRSCFDNFLTTRTWCLFSCYFLCILAHRYGFAIVHYHQLLLYQRKCKKKLQCMELMQARLINHKVNILNMHLNTILHQTRKYSNNPSNEQTLIQNHTKCYPFCTDSCFVSFNC